MTDTTQMYQIIRVSTDVDSAMMDAIIRKLEEFTKSIDQLLADIYQIDLALPQAKANSQSSKIFFKKDKNIINFEKIEPGFTRNWGLFTQRFLLLEYGLRTVNDRIKHTILADLKTIQADYRKTTDAMHRVYKGQKTKLDQQEKNFQMEYEKYTSLCEEIEQLQEIVNQNPGHPAPPKFGELKNTFKSIQDAAVEAHKNLNESKAIFHNKTEYILGLFERAETNREKGMNQVFGNLIDALSTLCDGKKTAAQRLASVFENLNVENELEGIFTPIEKLSGQSIVEFKPKDLPFDINQYLPADQSILL